MALLIDTEGVHPRRRASHLREAMMASPLPAHDASHSRFEADDFRARFHLRPVGDAYVADFLASGLQLKRSRHEVFAGGRRGRKGTAAIGFTPTCWKHGYRLRPHFNSVLSPRCGAADLLIGARWPMAGRG
jgi:hypothetical protein